MLLISNVLIFYTFKTARQQVRFAAAILNSTGSLDFLHGFKPRAFPILNIFQNPEKKFRVDANSIVSSSPTHSLNNHFMDI